MSTTVLDTTRWLTPTASINPITMHTLLHTTCRDANFCRSAGWTCFKHDSYTWGCNMPPVHPSATCVNGTATDPDTQTQTQTHSPPHTMCYASMVAFTTSHAETETKPTKGARTQGMWATYQYGNHGGVRSHEPRNREQWQAHVKNNWCGEEQ